MTLRDSTVHPWRRRINAFSGNEVQCRLGLILLAVLYWADLRVFEALEGLLLFRCQMSEQITVIPGVYREDRGCY